MSDKINLDISSRVLQKMFEYAGLASHHFDAEIAGWGHYNKEDGIYKLAPLQKQIVSGAEVDSFPNAILEDSKYDISDMIVQWHSHVNMNVTPSGVDRGNIRDILEVFPMVISIIVNCKNEYSAELNVKRMGSVLLAEPMKIEARLIPYYSLRTKLSKEVLTRCSKPKPVVVVEKMTEKKQIWGRKDGIWGYWTATGNFIPTGDGKATRAAQQDKLVSPAGGYNFYDNYYDDFLPPERSPEKIDYYKEIVELMIQLDKKNVDEFTYISTEVGNHYLTSTKTNCYLLINEYEIELNGNSVSGALTTGIDVWNEFLAKIGYFRQPYILEI